MVIVVDASISEYREVGCQGCRRTFAPLTRLVLDLRERPDLRAAFQTSDTYGAACPSCQRWNGRDMPLLVLEMARETPLVFACHDETLASVDPLSGSTLLLERVQHDLRVQRRMPAGPVLIVPFDVLAIAMGRDVDVDVADLRAACKAVKTTHGREAARRYRIFLGDVVASRSARQLNTAMEALQPTSAEQLQEILRRHPVLLTEAARERCRATIARAEDEGDELGVRIAVAQLEMLELAAEDRVHDGWERLAAVVRDVYAPTAEERLGPLVEAFDATVGHDKARAAELGEELAARASELGHSLSEADGLIRAASACYERSNGAGLRCRAILPTAGACPGRPGERAAQRDRRAEDPSADEPRSRGRSARARRSVGEPGACDQAA